MKTRTYDYFHFATRSEGYNRPKKKKRKQHIWRTGVTKKLQKTAILPSKMLAHTHGSGTPNAFLLFESCVCYRKTAEVSERLPQDWVKQDFLKSHKHYQGGCSNAYVIFVPLVWSDQSTDTAYLSHCLSLQEAFHRKKKKVSFQKFNSRWLAVKSK